MTRLLCSWISTLYLHFFFFFNDTATTEIYTLSLHDALPIFGGLELGVMDVDTRSSGPNPYSNFAVVRLRSEEHTSELQSQSNLVCRLLLEKKKHDIGATRAY